MNDCEFIGIFQRLTGHAPMPWQIKLFKEYFREGKTPSICNLPTGMGKTSIMAIWLIALALFPKKLPRRLVYIVNRRTVVDQATCEAERIRRNLNAAGLNHKLGTLCALKKGLPLAISTLRGQFGGNGEWCADPGRPAIIIGTVDMIGSRLLFSGYGQGFKTRPMHAGFLGQDTLLIHDEAHLEQPFQMLIEIINDEQCEGRLPDYKPLRVMALTATNRGNLDPDAYELTEEEKNPPEILPDIPNEPIHLVWRRFAAKKTITLHGVEEKMTAKAMATEALKYKSLNQAILIFASTIDKVDDIYGVLNQQNPERVEVLTGTIRGMERDALVLKPVFQRFLNGSNRTASVTPMDGTVYLICTSAGEVGIDISADHLICDLTPFESMAQRFGRVNRYGDIESKIAVFYPEKMNEQDPLAEVKQKTLGLLKKLRGNASPKSLSELPEEERLSAFSPSPTIIPATDILFDAWALTSVREALPGRPPVEPYLHGIETWQPPVSYIAWRKEVGLVTGELLEIYKPEDLLEDYPLKQHELLRDVASRVFAKMKAIAQRNPDLPVWLASQQGDVAVTTLADVFLNKGIKAKDANDQISNRIVILPPEAGGLNKGILDGQAIYVKEVDYDVSDRWIDEHDAPRRLKVWEKESVPDNMRLIRQIDLMPHRDETEETQEHGESRRFWCWYEQMKILGTQEIKSATKPVLLDVHNQDMASVMEKLVSALNLPETMQGALILAARFHDMGKQCNLWQRSIGNFKSAPPWLAKSGKGMRPIELTKYRHELGSLFYIVNERDFQQLNEDMKDLALHSIAAHHGRARPHFALEESFVPNSKGQDMSEVLFEISQRFVRLQRTFGRWGLAYLESLLRAVDYEASANPSSTVE